jgi:hypothetical protein
MTDQLPSLPPRCRVVMAGDPHDPDPPGGKGYVAERIRPGMTGRVDFTDSQRTVHVLWDTRDAGFRRGVTAAYARLLLPVMGAAEHWFGELRMTETVPDAPPRTAGVVMVSAGMNGVDLNPDGRHQPGTFLAAFDPDARDGYGEARWTGDPRKALVFGSVQEAARVWRTVSPSRPVRGDGRPNRPLTAYSVTFAAAPPGALVAWQQDGDR